MIETNLREILRGARARTIHDPHPDPKHEAFGHFPGDDPVFFDEQSTVQVTVRSRTKRKLERYFLKLIRSAAVKIPKECLASYRQLLPSAKSEVKNLARFEYQLSNPMFLPQTQSLLRAASGLRNIGSDEKAVSEFVSTFARSASVSFYVHSLAYSRLAVEPKIENAGTKGGNTKNPWWTKDREEHLLKYFLNLKNMGLPQIDIRLHWLTDMKDEGCPESAMKILDGDDALRSRITRLLKDYTEYEALLDGFDEQPFGDSPNLK